MSKTKEKIGNKCIEELCCFNHLSLVGHFLNELHVKQSNIGTDIFINHIDGQQFAVHSLMLGGHSGYFRCLLRKNKTPFKIFISDKDFSSLAIIETIRYMYEGRIKPTPKILPDLFIIAEKWQMYDLKGTLEEIVCRLLQDNSEWLLFCLSLIHNPQLYLSTNAINFILSKKTV